MLHKGNPFDELVLDLSPLRSPERFTDAAAFCLSLPGAADGVIVEAGSSLSSGLPTGDAGAAGEEGVQSGAELLAARADAFATEPIYRLPALAISWARPRSDAKALVRQPVQTAGAHSSPLEPTLAHSGPPGSAASGSKGSLRPLWMPKAAPSSRAAAGEACG